VPADRNIADVWSAMGGELKPSLDLIVTAPLDIERSLSAGPPVREVAFLDMVQAEPGSIKGTGKHKISRAQATADADFTATADATAEAGADKTGKDKAAKDRSGASLGVARLASSEGSASQSDLPDETFYGSVPGQPGRRIRVRAIPRPRPQR
jgi:hypothetical protein